MAAGGGTILYTPGVKASISVSSTKQILDISADIESGNLTLNENNMHSLNLTVSNPNGKYGGLFTPNDKIIVQLKRITWMQVFAGYLNKVPYFQVYPGSFNLSASCTLKRLKYHYWDPGYEDVIQFIAQAYNGGFGATTAASGADILANVALQQQTNSGMQNVIVNLLTQIVGWDPTKIHIGGIPGDWINQLQPIWNDLEIAVTNTLPSATAQGSVNALGPGTIAAGIAVGPGTQWTASDWAAAVLGFAACPVTLVNINNMLHWMANENLPSTWWGTAGQWNPLNNGLGSGGGSGLGSYANLYEAAKYAGQNIIGSLNGPYIGAALKSGDTALSDFAQACVDAPWASGHYYYDPSRIIDAIPIPNQLAPVAGGSVVLTTSDYLTNGTSIPIPETVGLPSSLPQPGTSSTTGPAQAPGAFEACTYAQQNWSQENGQDCSAFTQACWNAAGVSIPRTSEMQYNWSQLALVPLDQILPGDLVFAWYGYYSPPGHVGIYAGNDTVYQHDPPGTATLEKWIADAEAAQGFYGVGRITTTTQDQSNKTDQPTNPSATTVSTVASGLGTGTGNTGQGSLLYGQGTWQPGAATPDPNAASFTQAKLLMLDSPMMPYISDIVQTSMRNFCAAPNGDFIAWFPDYFGQFGYAATWHLSLIELIDFTISWSDENLVTHQFVAGATATDNTSIDPSVGGNISEQDEAFSYGVATIDMPGLLEALTGVGANDTGLFANVNNIYEQFGARPNFTAMPTVASPALAEFWFAVKLFQDNWANQFSCNVSMTFMPELWPGMLLAIDELQFQCYIHSVSHRWNLEDGAGFSTSVNVMAPSSTGANAGAASANGTGGLVGLARSGPIT